MKFTTYISIVFLSVGLYACSDDDLTSHLKNGQIEIVVTPSYDYDVSFVATADKITIDWGDDCFDNFSPNRDLQTFSHQYVNQDKHTIRIESENLVRFSNFFTGSNGLLISSGIFHELYVGEMNELKILNVIGELTVLEIKKANALKELICWGKLTSLDVGGVRGLTSLHCANNQLTSLDVRDLKALTSLYCFNNQLTTLNVRGLSALKELGCYVNQLKSLDVRGLSELTTLICADNQLISLDVRDLKELTMLYCYNNQLTTVDVRGLSALKELGCNNNKLSFIALNSLFESLPIRPAKDGSIIISNNTGSASCNPEIATYKGWKVFR